jgi:CxxC motif-containing protein (DUF1111 family)
MLNGRRPTLGLVPAPAITLGERGMRWSAAGRRPRVGPLAILGAALLLVGAILHWPVESARAVADVGGPLPGLSPEELGRFEAGAAVFARIHGPEDGLGPFFNGRACAECHAFPAPGGADKTRGHLTTRVGREAGDQYDNLIELGGPIITRHTVAPLLPGCNIDAEKKPKAATAVSERQPPALFGLGLVAAISDDTLAALAAVQQASGDDVVGRVNLADRGVGRFGTKAQFPTLDAFVADALRNELGITNPRLPDEKPTAQPAGVACDLRPDPEDDGAAVAMLVDFLTLLAPPPRGPVGAAEQRGAAIFQEVGCASCHVPSLRTGPSPIAALADQDVPLYSDLLLHDMGEYLADGIQQGEAGGADWRTPQLWGLGRRLWYLHDGRATDLRTVLELHNGEAKASRDRLFKRKRDDLQDVLTFLRSL